MHLDFFPQPFGPAHFFVASASTSLVAARQNVFERQPYVAGG
jgi:hypothetical protein